MVYASYFRKFKRPAEIGLAIIGCIAILYLGIQCIGSRPQYLIKTWEQPTTIAGDKYFLSIVAKRYFTWGSTAPTFYIYVGREPGQPGYGHFIDYSFFPSLDGTYDYQHFIKRTEVNWTKGGITLVTASKHRMFIPRDAYIGGR